MSSFTLDLLAAWRRLRFAPLPALGVVLTLGLGIAAVVTMHAVLHAVLIAPLPFPEPQRLVRLHEIDPQGQEFTTSQPNYLDFAEADSIELAAFEQRDLTLTGGERPRQVSGVLASASLFDVLGVEPAAGRLYTSEEDAPGGPPVVLLGAEFAERLGSRPADWPGRTLTVEGEPLTVLGVLPRGFAFPSGSELWLPLRADAGADRGDHWLTAVGRLRTGADRSTAQAELETLAANLEEEFPATNTEWGVAIEPFAQSLLGGLPARLWTLGGAAALLLLLACGNAAGLLLVQGIARRDEIAVRSALGAGKSRLVRQLLTEGLLLATLASVAGVALAFASLPLVRRMVAGQLPRAEEISVGGPTLLAALAATVVATLVSAFLPARRAIAGAAGGRLRARGGVDIGSARLQRALIVGQVALATLLLVAGGLLLRSTLRQQAFDSGFEMAETLVVPLSLNRAGLTGEGATSLAQRLEDSVRSLPGVRSVGVSSIQPFSGSSTVVQFSVEGKPADGPEEVPFSNWRMSTPGVFEVADIEPLAGEVYRRGSEDVAVVSRSFVETYLPGLTPQEAVGRRVAFGWNGENWWRIGGVVPDLRDTPLDRAGLPTFHVPYKGWRNIGLLVRTVTPPSTLAEPIRQAIWSVDQELAVPTVATMRSEFRETLREPQLQSGLMGTFALVAVALALIGLVGVVAYSVRRRRREIGVRVAVGASPGEIRSMFLVDGLRLGILGVGLGLVASLATARALESQLYETSGTDPRLLGVVALVLLGACAAASLGPAMRASRVGASQTLRGD